MNGPTNPPSFDPQFVAASAPEADPESELSLAVPAHFDDRWTHGRMERMRRDWLKDELLRAIVRLQMGRRV